MKCFYHKTDLDGHCSGALIKLQYPDCEMIGVDYADYVRDFKVRLGEVVYVVDFRFPIDEMEWLSSFAKLHWIDHHKTSIDEAHETGFLASGGQHLEIGKAACELVWEYLYPGEKAPVSVWLLGRYDVWDHVDERVMPFQWGMRNFADTLPDQVIFWADVIRSPSYLTEIMNTGRVLLEYQRVQDMKYAKGMAYEAEFNGLRAIIMNKAYANSKAFDAVYDPEKHDVMVMFAIKPGQYKYTLFCDKPEIDVSAIAKKYGGGGHRGAAGFFSDKILI